MSIRSFSGRPLTLGGIRIPYLFGLQGHSDADVLLHAICDALLGAIAEGDIGRHFPDTDPQYKDIKSTLLLKKVWTKVREKGFHLQNIDATVVAERPKLSDFIPRMVKEIADTLETGIGKGQCQSHDNGRTGIHGQGRRDLRLCRGPGGRRRNTQIQAPNTK